jgi:hypothetical protein
MRGKDVSKMLEDYNTEKEVRDCFVVEGRKIEGESVLVYAYLEMNNDKKLEEYLKALGEGKTIAVI